MADSEKVSDRISVICQETWDRFVQATIRNELPRLAEWPKVKPSVDELVEVVVHGGIFDGLARRIDKEMPIQTQMLAAGAVRDLHCWFVRLVQNWALSYEWNDSGEPTAALRKAVRAIVSLISHGGDIRGSCHRHALDALGELLWEAQDRDCGDVVLQALCDELAHRNLKGLISRFDMVSIMEEMENRGFILHEDFSASVLHSTVNRNNDEEEQSLRV